MKYDNTLPITERHKHGDQSSLVDRLWIEGKYLPQLSGEVLYVGVNYYTDFYHELVKDPSLFTTVDMDVKVAKYGSPYNHYVDNIEDFLEYADQYNHISVFGLFGCGHSVIKDRKVILGILNKCYDHVKDGGTIHFGTSTDILSVEDSMDMVRSSNLKDAKILSSFTCKPSQIHSEVFMFWGAKNAT